MRSAAKPIIRRATPQDWSRIWPIVSAVFAAGDTYAMPRDTSEDVARQYWMGDGVNTYVAEIGHDVVGTYALRANQRGPGAHVANAGYMVNRAVESHGVGAAMCEHSMQEARSMSFRAMQFNAVVSTNVRAVALWRRMGFRIVGTVPQAFRLPTNDFADLLVMHRFL